MRRSALKAALLIAAIVASLAAAPVVAETEAEADGVEGMWRSANREARIELRLCGKDNEELCAWLTWARDKSPKVQRDVGTQIMKPAQRIGPKAWKGEVNVAGYHLSGTVTHHRRNRIKLEGCVAFVICGDYEIRRIRPR